MIDVSNPAAPVEVGFYDTPGDALGVTVAWAYAYLADEGSGLEILTSCSAELFSDGFESGETSAWPVTLP